MVRLISRKNYDKLGVLIKAYFGFQKHFTWIKNVNHPGIKPCIYALWHAHQFCVFGIPEKENLSIMISSSLDGEIIASGVEMLGIKTVRGSTGRYGSVSGTMQLIDRLTEGECGAITVDGPRGPAGKVKGGIVKIARKANVPIVPVVWHSNQWNFFRLPGWDKMTAPFGPANLVNLYGEPIYAEGDDNSVMEKIQKSLEDLEKRVKGVNVCK
jgi:lysophospholipid acyltransferase (LPLAT)-like uncharacterized protein